MTKSKNGIPPLYAVKSASCRKVFCLVKDQHIRSNLAKIREFLILMLIMILSSLIPAFAESTQEVNVTNLNQITQQLNVLNSQVQASINTNFVIIGISFAIAVLAVIFTIIQASYLRRQVILTEKETEVRLQPWIIIEDLIPIQAELKNGALVSYEDWLKVTEAKPATRIIFSISIKNIGHNVARNISHKMIVKDEKFSREIFEEDVEGGFMNVLPPNAKFFEVIRLPYDRFMQLETLPKYVGISVSYDGINDKKYSGVIYELLSGRYKMMDSWMT